MKSIIKKYRRIIKNTIITFLIIGIGLFAGIVYFLYFIPNIHLKDKKTYYLYVYENTDFNNIFTTLKKDEIIKYKKSLKFLSIFEDFDISIKPGKYELKDKMSNLKLLCLLEKGKESPTNISFNNIRTTDVLAARLSKQLMIDSAAIMNVLKDSKLLGTYGYTPDNIASVFIPNTYEVYWTIKPKDLLERMIREHQIFWNKQRKKQALTIGFTPLEVSIIASIVEEETNKKTEKPTVAGLYINRLHKNMPLQADPTIRFALNDFHIKRVLRGHLEVASPYNTYKNTGLPPGPICLPSIESIDAVLNYEKHQYLYMCAKDDLSGYHAFASNFSEHQKNAYKYRMALNKLKIR